MIDYKQNIYNSGLSIYDMIDSKDRNLFIPIYDLEKLISTKLIGISLAGLPLRTRSKLVKEKICEALGYPVPNSFARTQPRFLGQNFDVYIQKRFNVQIWNEEVDATRRYVFIKVDENDVISSVRVISGEVLAQFDNTGKLTTKYQAMMHSFDSSCLFSKDSIKVSDWILYPQDSLCDINPNCYPMRDQLLCIEDVYDRLLPMVGLSINYLNALQERNRGAQLHALVCKYLGYSTYEDDGSYPDIANQLLEVKLQTSPTIDLGLHSPNDGVSIITVDDIVFNSEDIRYVIFDASIDGDYIKLNKLYIVAGYQFVKYFPMFKGKNAKIQLSLPSDFFN